MPPTFGEWELERGSECDEIDGLEEPDATGNASSAGLASDLTESWHKSKKGKTEEETCLSSVAYTLEFGPAIALLRSAKYRSLSR